MAHDTDGHVTRLQVSRTVDAPPEAVFAVLRDPQGHVAIDSSGMLQDATGSPVSSVGDRFTVHMDRDSLNDYPELGRYDVEVEIVDYEQDRRIAWTIHGQIKPSFGHVYGYELAPTDGRGTEVTSFYDWSDLHPDWAAMDLFPVIPESALRATLGILDRTVRRAT